MQFLTSISVKLRHIEAHSGLFWKQEDYFNRGKSGYDRKDRDPTLTINQTKKKRGRKTWEKDEKGGLKCDLNCDKNKDKTST